MKIYIISLLNSTKRRINVTNIMSKLNITNYTIIDAIDGSKLEHFYTYKNWRDPWSKLHLTKGEVGCALSHLLVWDKIISSDDISSIILEDDFIINNEKDFYILATYNGPVNFDLLYLGRKKMDNEPESQVNIDYLNLSSSALKSSLSYWTIGYILSKKGAQYLKNGKINSVPYKECIFPVDEYIPWMFGKNSIYGLENIPNNNNMNYYALDPPIITPNDSYISSSTYFSNPVPSSNNKIILITVATEYNDCVKRYKQSSMRYGFDPIILGLDDQWKGGNMSDGMGGGQKINLLKQYLSTLDTNTLIIFTDSYDVIINNHITEITDNYNTYYKDLIVFGSEKYCWPDTNLKNKYPETHAENKYLNSGNFMGWSDDIINLIKIPINDNDDDQLYYTHRFFESYPKTVLDYNNHIFLCLNNDYNLKIDYNKSCVNIKNNRPGFIHGNGPESTKNRLNRISNYCVHGWNIVYGYKNVNPTNILPRIMLIYENTPSYNELTINSILNIDYPKDNIIHVHVNNNNHNNIDQFINIESNSNIFQTLENMVEKYNCEYVFYINSNAVLENSNILRNLVYENKSIIGPLLKCKDSLFSNFWGDIDTDYFYKRSDDYIDLTNRQKQGCWNVPYIWHALLIHKAHFKSDMFTTNTDKGDGIDMAFCYNIRKNNCFMWMLNNQHYGYYYDHDINLLSFKHNKERWEHKYIINNFKTIDLGSDILKIQMFTPDFCSEILTIANQNNNWSRGGKTHYDNRINNIENHPTQDIHLNQLNLDELWQFIVNNYIQNIMWNTYKYSTKDINISFIVKYDLQTQKKLNPHHDSSSYTVNLCLNNNFQGGGCKFIRQNKTIINKDIGSILIHPGKITHYHEGLPITEGERFILVSFIN